MKANKQKKIITKKKANNKNPGESSHTNSKDSLRESSYHRYEFIDITTSDVAFIAYGRTLSELFENAALATFEVMIDLNKVKAKKQRNIEVTGHDLMALMFNWINELLVYVDSESLAFSRFDVKVDEKAICKLLNDSNDKTSKEIVKSASQISHNILKLKAVCRGEKIDKKKHELGTVVKSCTYHKMEITKKDRVWRAQVILDI